MSQVLRAVFECNGMRRTHGLAGQLNRYKVAAENTLRYEFLDGSFLPTAWPDTMVLQVSTFCSAFMAFLLINFASRDCSMMLLLRESTVLLPEFSSHILLVLIYQCLNLSTHHTLSFILPVLPITHLYTRMNFVLCCRMLTVFLFLLTCHSRFLLSMAERSQELSVILSMKKIMISSDARFGISVDPTSFLLSCVELC